MGVRLKALFKHSRTLRASPGPSAQLIPTTTSSYMALLNLTYSCLLICTPTLTDSGLTLDQSNVVPKHDPYSRSARAAPSARYETSCFGFCPGDTPFRGERVPLLSTYVAAALSRADSDEIASEGPSCCTSVWTKSSGAFAPGGTSTARPVLGLDEGFIARCGTAECATT